MWSGSDHHLVYLNRPPEQEQHNCGRRSGGDSEDNNQPSRRYVKLGGAGESQTSLFLELALTALSKRDQMFLEHYQTETVSEVAAFYNITHAAVYCRIARLRQKLSHTARLLKNR